MSETEAWVLAVGVLVWAHWFLNRTYAFVYKRRLKFRYSWAAHGLLLFCKRAPEWEVDDGGR